MPAKKRGNIVVHFFRASGAAAARPSCSSEVLGQIVQGFSSASCVMGATQPPAPLGDASVAGSFSQGSARKFVCNKGASPVTSRSSSSRDPFSRHRLLGGNVVAAV